MRNSRKSTPREMVSIFGVPAGVLVGLLGTAALAASLNGTLASLVAKITNDANTSGISGIWMQEFGYDTAVQAFHTVADCDTSTQSNNAVAACSYNKYGGDLRMQPGVTRSTSVRIKNASTTTTAGTFTAKFGPCSISADLVGAATASLCSHMTLTLRAQHVDAANAPVGTAVVVFANLTPAQLAAHNGTGLFTVAGAGGVLTPHGIGPGHAVDLVFELTPDEHLLDNDDANTSLRQAITWEFTA